MLETNFLNHYNTLTWRPCLESKHGEDRAWKPFLKSLEMNPWMGESSRLLPYINVMENHWFVVKKRSQPDLQALSCVLAPVVTWESFSLERKL